MRELTPFEKECIRTGLQHLFRPGGFFSICELEVMLRLAGAIPPQRTMDALRSIHCVSWSAMTAQMRQATAQEVLGLFEHNGFDLPALDKTFLPPPEKTEQPKVEGGFLSRLLPKGLLS